MNKILWLSPNFNHYKARFLNRFAGQESIELHILAGEGNQSLGHYEIGGQWEFTLHRIPVSKKSFGFSLKVYFFLFRHYKSFDWIMIPREKKNILLILFSFFLRYILFRNSQTKLFSYNHPFFGNRYREGYEAALLKFFYRWYDKTIFYTEISKTKVLDKKLIAGKKAGSANNTLDSHEIEKYYQFEYPDYEKPTILYIGRLIKSKKIETIFKYYKMLDLRFSDLGKKLSIEIVGDGPLRDLVKEYSSDNQWIIHHGMVNREEHLSRIFTRASFVFIPGLSGLSINHSFLYGRPFVTIQSTGHGPEIDYLIHGNNGYILSGDIEQDVHVLFSLLEDEEKLRRMCNNAYQTGKLLGVDRWCEQVLSSLNPDNKQKL